MTIQEILDTTQRANSMMSSLNYRLVVVCKYRSNSGISSFNPKTYSDFENWISRTASLSSFYTIISANFNLAPDPAYNDRQSALLKLDDNTSLEITLFGVPCK